MERCVYESLMKKLSSVTSACIVTIVNNSENSVDQESEKLLVTARELEEGLFLDKLGEEVSSIVNEVLICGGIKVIEQADNKIILIEAVSPKPKLVILGGGHVAKPVVEIAAKLGFHITVFDDRPMYANKTRFSEADEVICDGFDKVETRLEFDKSTYVVIVTRGHRYDMDCLLQVLKYDTAYTGMMGSKHRVEFLRDKLLESGISKEMLNKLKAPIGLGIGAVTPEEIALSILSEVTSVRRLRQRNINGTIQEVKNKVTEFDEYVYKELAKQRDEAVAIATIIATRGSVPRHEGAKMIIYADGRITGSIGGGCSEAEVVTEARDLIRSGCFKKVVVDMTDEDTEREGMVCGGTLEVLIEVY